MKNVYTCRLARSISPMGSLWIYCKRFLRFFDPDRLCCSPFWKSITASHILAGAQHIARRPTKAEVPRGKKDKFHSISIWVSGIRKSAPNLFPPFPTNTSPLDPVVMLQAISLLAHGTSPKGRPRQKCPVKKRTCPSSIQFPFEFRDSKIGPKFVSSLSDKHISSGPCCNVAFFDHLPVWKWVWISEARSENGCGKWHFLVWNRVRVWRSGRHTPTKNS